MTMIDVDKFMASLIKYYCEAYGIDRTSIRCWFDDALEEQGLEYKDGEIVKTQRKVAAEAKEAIFDDEDERIRKGLLKFLESVWHLGKNAPLEKWDKSDCSKWIAWLEKQGKQKHPVIDFKANNWYVSKVDGKIYDMTYNPTDNIEPKFKVGDFILNGDVTTDGKPEIFKIRNVCSDWYDVENIYDGRGGIITFKQEQSCRLWDITDSKDGDVLVDGNFVGLFKENNYNPSDESGCAYFYCSFDMDNNKFYTEFGGYNPTYLYPAIKEQRDFLFKKMQEAGYEWDAEKKELKLLISNGGDFDTKNCEQNPAWSEEDDAMLGCVIEDIECVKGYTVNDDLIATYIDEIEWLKCLKQRLEEK